MEKFIRAVICNADGTVHAVLRAGSTARYEGRLAEDIEGVLAVYDGTARGDGVDSDAIISSTHKQLLVPAVVGEAVRGIHPILCCRLHVGREVWLPEDV